MLEKCNKNVAQRLEKCNLDNLLSNSEYNIKKAYTLCNGNVEVVDNRIYIPIYMIMFFQK